MIAKLALIIVISVLFSTIPCSADLIRLHEYMIDSGSFVVPSNHKVEEPYSADGIYYEGLSWGIGKNKLFMILIAKCDVPTDPRILQYSLMANSFCNESGKWKSSSVIAVEKPYPGWLSACDARGKGAPVTIYAGSVDNETILVVSTTETPEIMGRLLGSLRVIPPEGVSEALAANRIKSY
jgi:hypothetical protein